MKKLLQKLVLMTSIAFLFVGMQTAYGYENKADIEAAMVGNDCISPKEENQYIITIIEEPIITGNETEETSEDGKDFITRTCYRVTVLFQLNNEKGTKQEVVPAFKKECPKIDESTDFPGKTTLYCKRVQVLLSTGGTNLINNYIAMIYRWAASIVGLIAVIVIVLSGMQIAISGGDSQAIDAAKKRILQSIGGLAVLFLSGVILYSINPTFFTF